MYVGGDFDTLFQNARQRIKFTMLSTKAIIEKSLGVGGQEIECECIVCAQEDIWYQRRSCYSINEMANMI